MNPSIREMTNPERACASDFEIVAPERGFVPALSLRVYAIDAVADGSISALTDTDDSRDCARALAAAGLITLAEPLS